MLQTMPHLAPAASSSPSPSFAGLLAALASRPSAQPVRSGAWNDSALADDVATLSYERALRTHARYHAHEPAGTPIEAQGETLTVGEGAVQAEAERGTAAFSIDTAADPRTDAAVDEITAVEEGNRKCASVTIRLSRTECEQLRKRAAEAGLTVSAYLRSCTFEAESLRALVKDTLAQLRSAPAGERRNWWRWLGRWWPRLHHGEPAAQA